MLFLLLLVILPAGAGAQEFNHTITVYAVVPEQRAVYLDESGNIVKVTGNTAKNVTPTVYDSHNKEITMTDAVQDQYDDFLKQHHNQLEAGKIYKLNPLKVSAAPNNQTISVGNKPQMLSLSF